MCLELIHSNVTYVLHEIRTHSVQCMTYPAGKSNVYLLPTMNFAFQIFGTPCNLNVPHVNLCQVMKEVSRPTVRPLEQSKHGVPTVRLAVARTSSRRRKKVDRDNNLREKKYK